MGLENYVATASMEQLDLGSEDDNLFDDYEQQKNNDKSQQISKNFVEKYYQGR